MKYATNHTFYDVSRTTDSLQNIDSIQINHSYLLTCVYMNAIIFSLNSQYNLVTTGESEADRYSSIYFDSPTPQELTTGNGMELTIVEEGVSYSGINLQNSFSVSYNRVTFLHKELQDGFTLDYNIEYRDRYNRHPLTNLCIAKVYSNNDISPIMETLKTHGVRTTDVRKYSLGKAFCVVNSLALPETKHRQIKKLTQKNDEKWIAMC